MIQYLLEFSPMYDRVRAHSPYVFYADVFLYITFVLLVLFGLPWLVHWMYRGKVK